MTDQKSDQDALDALVDDCYGGKWPWRKGDWIEYKSLHRGDAFKVVLYINKDSEGNTIIRPNTPPGYFSEESFNEEFCPLAGTWVEGRLREILGDRFIKLEFGAKSWDCSVFTEPDGEPAIIQRVRSDSPIQALVAALREVLKQKEVKGG